MGDVNTRGRYTYTERGVGEAVRKNCANDNTTHVIRKCLSTPHGAQWSDVMKIVNEKCPFRDASTQKFDDIGKKEVNIGFF